MRVLAFIIGVAFIGLALWQQDEEKRSKGRGRLNDILTDFGGGSFEEGVRASVGSGAHGCLTKIFGWFGLLAILYALASGE